MTAVTSPPSPATAPPAAARHRRPEVPLRTRLVTAALVLATVVAGALLVRLKPDQEHGGRPFLRPGKVGGIVDAGTFQVVVLDAAGGTKLQNPARNLTLDTTGVWVLVRVRVTATREPIILQYARLRDDRDRTFTATGRIGQPLTDGRMFQPGVWVEGHIVFEVARDAKDLTLLLGEHSGLGPGPLTLAEVPIAAAVPAWAGQTTTLDVPRARLAS